MKKQNYNFEIFLKKLSELRYSQSQVASSQELKESQEINELREIVLDVAEENEQFFSTT